MSLNANQKGKRFELKIAKDLAKKFDTNIRRTPNSGGLSIKGDIMTTSTRLNSSHGYISYAVFCLKKKNKSTAE